MTNLNKESVKDKAEHVSENAKNNISELSKDMKTTAKMAADEVVYKTGQAEDEAVNLVENIRQLVTGYANTEKLNQVKSDVAEKAKRIKENASEECAVAVDKTRTKVKENPIGSVAVAAGVGALLGYVLANRNK